MNLNTMSNEQILAFISSNLEKKRLSNKINSEELAKKGGHNAQTYSNFINKNTDIRLSTFIQILRGLGELNKLHEVIEYKIPYSPMGNSNIVQKRIRASHVKERSIKWGDE